MRRLLVIGLLVTSLACSSSGRDSVRDEPSATATPSSTASAEPSESTSPATSPSLSSPAAQRPAEFVAIEGDRLAVFDGADGSRVRFLTESQPGPGLSHPSLVGDTVYFLRREAECGASVHAVLLAGGPEKVVVSRPAGHTIGALDAAPDGTLAFTDSACEGGATELVVRTPGKSERRWKLDEAAESYGIEYLKLAADSASALLITDGACIDWCGADSTTVRRLDLRGSGGKVSDGPKVPQDAKVECSVTAVTPEPGGVLAACSTHQSDPPVMQSQPRPTPDTVVQRWTGESGIAPLFATGADRSKTIASLDLDPSGRFLLVGLVGGGVYRWQPGSNPVRMSGASHPTW